MDVLVVSLLVFTRIFAVAMTAPILGSHAVAVRTRCAVAFAVMVLVIPLVGVPESILGSARGQGSELLQRLFHLALGEATIGLAMGLSVAIMFSAASAAGTVVSQMAGMNIGVSPGEGNELGSGALAKLFSVLSLAAFAVIGGPAMVMTAVADTFVHLPLGTTLFTDGLPALIGELLHQSYLLTLRAVGPVIACLLVSNIVVGIISRTYPQMNLLGMGLTSNMVVMIGAVFLTIGGTVWLFVDDVKPTLDWTQQQLKSIAIEPTLGGNPVASELTDERRIGQLDWQIHRMRSHR